MFRTKLQPVTYSHSILMTVGTLLKGSLPILAALLVCSIPGSASAQSATATPESEEIVRLREQKTRAELEKDIAVAEKAKLEAQFPKPTTSPLAGETKINDGAVIESDMMSYISLADSADTLVKTLKDSKLPIKRLAIYSKPEADLLLNYRVTTNQIELVRQQYCKAIRQHPRCPANHAFEAINGINSNRVMEKIGPLGLMSIGGSLLGAFVDMTALLRTNVTVQGHSIDINESSFVSEVFRAIRAPNGLTSRPALFYPATFPPVIDADTPSEILGRLEAVYELKSYTAGAIQSLDDNLKKVKKTAAKIEELEAAVVSIQGGQQKAQDEMSALVRTQRMYGRRTPFEAQQRIEELRKLQADLSRDLYRTNKDLDEKKLALKNLESQQAELLKRLANGFQTADLEDTVARLKILNERFDQFVAALIKVDAATGINSLTAFIKAENLKQALGDDGDSYWLQLAVVKAGGNNRIKTNLVTDIFTGGNRISHSGGVIVQYNLYDRTGRSVVSDTLTQYSGYVKASKIKKFTNPRVIEPDNGKQDTEAKRKAVAGPATVAKSAE